MYITANLTVHFHQGSPLIKQQSFEHR